MIIQQCLVSERFRDLDMNRIFKTDSKDVTDMLVAHECAHALYTPTNGWKRIADDNELRSYVNVLEDCIFLSDQRNRLSSFYVQWNACNKLLRDIQVYRTSSKVLQNR